MTTPDGPASREDLLSELTWKKFPVLDDGFVCLVDVMGDDGAVVQAARVSYGEGTKRVSDDRTLIRYLMRHRHSTPFEMAEIKLLVRVPMDTWRQWIRHRTACLSGDTKLYFDLPGAKKRGGRQRHNVTIADFHRMWHQGTESECNPKKKPTHVERVEQGREYTVPELARLVDRREEDLRNMICDGRLQGDKRSGRLFVTGKAWHEWAGRCVRRNTPIRDRLRKMELRTCDEQTGEIVSTQVTDIWSTGVRPVYRVTLENGYAIKMTEDHLCLTEAGWQTLGEATGLRRSERGGVSWDSDAPAFAVNGVSLHRDAEWLAERRAEGWSVSEIASEAGVSYHTIRKALQKFSLQFTNAEKGKLSGRSQRGRRRSVPKRGPLQGQALQNVRAARSGPASNFWKGGVSSERAKIGRWTTDQAARVHESNNHCCVICGSKKELETHHVDPVWNNPERAYDLQNLTTLCYECHNGIHVLNLELRLLEMFEAGTVMQFWDGETKPQPRPKKNRKPAVRRLRRTWSKVARIEFAGDEETFDLSVEGPDHNFVANGFVVHNSVNEYSTRYSVAIDSAYKTGSDEWRLQATSNRQGSSGFADDSLGEELTKAEGELLDAIRSAYEKRLDAGIAREQARKDLPLSTYTEAYWKIDLHNMLHFLSLRMDEHAQWEIRAYATAIGEQIVKPLFPVVWEAFEDYRRGGMFLTRLDREVIARLVTTAAEQGSSLPADRELFLSCQDESWTNLKRSRERDECWAKLQRLGLVAEADSGSE